MLNNLTIIMAAIALLLSVSQAATASSDNKCNENHPHNPCQKHISNEDNKRKITICHKPDTNHPQTILIDSSSLNTHLNHGDHEGKCKPTAYMITPLSFGSLAASSPGKVIINPRTSSRTTYGDIVLLDNNQYPAEFIVELNDNETISALLPSQIVITNGGKNIIVDNLTSYISYKRKGQHKEATIYVGGRLNLNETTPPGAYESIFNIDVETNE